MLWHGCLKVEEHKQECIETDSTNFKHVSPKTSPNYLQYKEGREGGALIPFPRKLLFFFFQIPACVAQIEIPFPFFYCFFFHESQSQCTKSQCTKSHFPASKKANPSSHFTPSRSSSLGGPRLKDGKSSRWPTKISSIPYMLVNSKIYNCQHVNDRNIAVKNDCKTRGK